MVEAYHTLPGRESVAIRGLMPPADFPVMPDIRLEVFVREPQIGAGRAPQAVYPNSAKMTHL